MSYMPVIPAQLQYTTGNLHKSLFTKLDCSDTLVAVHEALPAFHAGNSPGYTAGSIQNDYMLIFS